MKKITILLVIIFTFLFSTTSWGEWSYVEENVSGDKFYYDKERVRKSGKYLYFWDLINSIKPLPGGTLSSTTYVQLDCSVFRFKNLKITTYENSMGEGEIIMDFTPTDEWEYPYPDSSIEVMFNKICEEHQ